MTEDDADDIFEDWHLGLYEPWLSLRDVFINLHGWTDAEFETWAMTGRVPNE